MGTLSLYMIKQDNILRERVVVAGMVLALILCFSSMLDIARDINLDWTIYKICLAIALAILSFCITLKSWGK
jgi:hypothetical protein